MSKARSPVENLKTQGEVEALMRPDGGTAVIDFWAPWCAPCVAMAPHFDKVAGDFSEAPVRFIKINTQDHPALGQAFNVRALPTMAFIHNGEVLDVFVGARGAGAIASKVEWLLSKARGEGFWTRLLGRSKKS